LFFSNHSPTNSQDFPEKASWIEHKVVAILNTFGRALTELYTCHWMR
jgi:hypothetical protein